MLYEQKVFVVENIRFGNVTLPFDVANTTNMEWVSQHNFLNVRSIPDETARSRAKLTDDMEAYYFGSQENPQIGDTRVSFRHVHPQEMSVLARQQKGGALVPFCWFETCDDHALVLVQAGTHSALEMLRHANIMNGVSELLRIWVLRLFGWLVLVGIMRRILHRMVLVLLSDDNGSNPHLPLEDRKGLGFASFLLGTIVTAIVIAIAWIGYQPRILIVSVLLVLLLVAGGSWLGANIMRALSNTFIDSSKECQYEMFQYKLIITDDDENDDDVRNKNAVEI